MKVGKQPTFAEDIDALKKQVENLTMALRISQALMQQVLPSVQNMGNDIKNVSSMFNDFQYRFLAMQKLMDVDVIKMAQIADELKLADWEKASDADDVERELVVADSVESPQDIVIFTSDVYDKPEAGIFRSKMVLAETGNQEMIDRLQGMVVGTKLSVELAGNTHHITLLGVRRAKE